MNLWNDPDKDFWFEVTQIVVHQRNGVWLTAKRVLRDIYFTANQLRLHL